MGLHARLMGVTGTIWSRGRRTALYIEASIVARPMVQNISLELVSVQWHDRAASALSNVATQCPPPAANRSTNV